MTERIPYVMRRLTMRVTDPFGYLICEMSAMVPDHLVSNIETEWTNTFNLKARHNHDVSYRVDVVVQ